MRSLAENQDVAGLHKMPTGIEGFDSITGGGLPRNRTSLIIGDPGGGKTVFALQTLVNGARQFGEPGIFVAFEENSRRILANAASFGWNLPKLERKQLFFFDAKMGPDVIMAGEFDLSGMLAGIKAEADARGARRIVFDAVDALLTLLDDRFADIVMFDKFASVCRRQAFIDFARKPVVVIQQAFDRLLHKRFRHAAL